MTCNGEETIVTVDTEDESVCPIIVSTVGTISDTPPAELPPLYDVIDPVALKELFTDPSAGHVTFEYADHVVCVEEGTIVISEAPYNAITG